MFLTVDMEDRVISDLTDGHVSPKETYSENFMLRSLLEVCQEGGSFMGVLGGH